MRPLWLSLHIHSGAGSESLSFAWSVKSSWLAKPRWLEVRDRAVDVVLLVALLLKCKAGLTSVILVKLIRDINYS